jgi:hypothetical protein
MAKTNNQSREQKRTGILKWQRFEAFWKQSGRGLLLLAGLALGSSACAPPGQRWAQWEQWQQLQQEQRQQQALLRERLTPQVVQGAKLQVGSQCPLGFVVPPRAVPLEIWNCPRQSSVLEVTRSLPPLELQADCKKKTLDVRSLEDPHLEPNTWEILPDGRFYLKWEPPFVQLADGCELEVPLELSGRVHCDKRDQAIIEVLFRWDLAACGFEEGCVLQAKAQIDQCL